MKLILGLLSSLTCEQCMEVLPIVSSLQQNEFVSVRELTYDVFMWIYEHCR